MEFHPNIAPIDVIKKGAFGAAYFRDIYSNVTGNFYENDWKEFEELKNIDKKYYCSGFYGVEVATSLRFSEDKGWINEIDFYGWFQWYFRYWEERRSEDDIRQISRWNRIINRFVGI